jgi:hypothetical protein
VDWPTINKMAMMGASQLRHDTGVGDGDYVDVFAAMASAKVSCMAQPLDGLAGVYVGPATMGPAAVINSALGEIPMRQTAAHELGHHVFGHDSRLDEQADPDHGTLGTPLPDEEKLAEAFAGWFLMPKRAVLAAMRRAQVVRPASPVDVHQIACWLGTSFAGTARHLTVLGLADARQDREWKREWHSKGPQIRAALAGRQGSLPERVWLIRPAADQAVLHVLPGDCLVCSGEYVPETLPRGLEELPQEQLALEPQLSIVVTSALTRQVCLSLRGPKGFGSIDVTLAVPPRRLGIDYAWQPRQDPSLPEPEEP